ncbi:histidinol-phosphate phosphatase family protein [Candidatus Omnitrophus magneticus]|uniref:Histidinol-phosphate phosphatase family protein n=1 Tax=Candidatus Omnitrophus magneticus TaxID=1609969 RepID=A0A0F0CM71_9BACT|nr:histidinol-phosphate phosphatase family protein [Candidatus Omnitrophus magneticus]
MNEIDGVRAIMPRINNNWVDEIIVVDGGSTDGTYQYFEENNYKIIKQQSKGVTGAYWEGMEASIGDVIIAFSPDNNSIPETIPLLVEEMQEGYDMVIASRYYQDAKSEDDDIVTALGNWMFTKIVNILFGSDYTDSLVMFRAFKKNIPYEYKMQSRKHPTFELELAIKCAKHKLKVKDIPVDEPKRIGGKRKMRPLYNGATLIVKITSEVVI